MARKAMMAKAQKPAKFSVRKYNRGPICVRSRGFLRKYSMCRICFRQLANKGEIHGVIKAYW